MNLKFDKFIKNYMIEIILAAVVMLIGTFLGPLGIVVVLGAIAWIVWLLYQFMMGN